MSTTRKLWLGLAALLISSFAVLLWVGDVVHQEAPPLPTAVVTSEGQTLYTRADLQEGRQVWQSIGGQQLGSIWGHGALLAPDWSADWLHREAMAMLELLARDEGAASFASLDAAQQAALKARIQPELRHNTYDAVTDTITVAVVPPIHVDIGRDTLVVVDQPLQFQATTNDVFRDDYHWSPSTGLSDPGIANPIALFESGMNEITYEVTATDTFGCSGAGSIKITIAHTLPDIFVPNAFTPGTNSNNIFRPVCIGIASLDYFRVFNRWGQLLYSTSQIGQGWDGRIQGRWPESSPYMWIARGTDYTGRVISKKGVVMLIR